VVLALIRYSNSFERAPCMPGRPLQRKPSMTGNRVPPVYPLTDFFRNPEQGFFRLSDDGRLLSFMKPVSFDGGPARMNIFVQTLEGSEPVGEARCLTRETERDIAEY